MSRIHASWLAIVVLLISAADVRAQRVRAQHAAQGLPHGSAGVVHHRAPWGWGWGWGYPVYGYPVWDGYWYGTGYHGTWLGDLYAGAGAFLQGAGAFELYDAMAGETNARAFMALNQYAYLSQLEAGQRYKLGRQLRHQRLVTLRRAIDERLLHDPTEHDINVGDALNAAAAVVTRHTPFRWAPGPLSVAIPPGCFGDLTFLIPAEGVRINLHEVLNANQWPIGLRGDLFAPERDAYETAIHRVLVEFRNGTLTPRTLQQVDQAVQRLRAKLDKQSPLDFVDADEAVRHVTALAATAKTLRSPRGRDVLQPLSTRPPRTLGALIGFMNMHNLRFGPAQTARQQKAHQDFYPILADARDEAMQQARAGQAAVEVALARAVK